jgi:hypothetical protein
MPLRMGAAQASGVPWGEGLGKSCYGKLGGGRISNGISKAQRGKTHRHCAHVADETTRHGAGEIQFVVEQRIIPSGHSCVNARLQVSQMAQLTDDPPADFLDDVGHVGIAGQLAIDKAGRETLVRAIDKAPLDEDNVLMKVPIEVAAESL